MNVLVVGDRAREHAIAWKVAQDPDCDRIFTTRTEDGTRDIAENTRLKPTDIEGLKRFARQNVDLTIVGSEAPLALGLGDAFREDNLLIFGHDKATMKLETKKDFSKKFMTEKRIATAQYGIYSDYDEAVAELQARDLPVMLKATGLAEARGTDPCFSYEAGEKFLHELMVERRLGEAGETVVIEDYLTGPEVSLHAWSDEHTYQMFPASQDHKYLRDGDTGPITGGVGVVCPLPAISRAVERRLGKRFVAPAHAGLIERGKKPNGIIYPGLMMTPQGPKCLEYNMRFGAPEAEVYMRLLQSNLLSMVMACIDGRLEQEKARWSHKYAACVVMTSDGYPGEYVTGYPIDGLEDAAKVKGVEIFHGATRYANGHYLTNGGRVLSVTALAGTLELAIQRAYQAVEKIDFEGKYYRTDIGQKALSMGRLALL